MKNSNNTPLFEAVGRLVKLTTNKIDPYGYTIACNTGIVYDIVDNSCYFIPIQMEGHIKVYERVRFSVTDKDTCNILPTPTEEDIYKFFISKALYTTSFSGCSLGADPEIFVVDENNKVIPAFKFLPSKDIGNPFWDGFQAEFILPTKERGNPSCLSYLVDSIYARLHDVKRNARAYNKNARLTWISVVDIPIDTMMEAEYKHIQLGCAPSFNAYNSPPIFVEDPTSLPIRFAGCHMHFGIRYMIDRIRKFSKVNDDVLINNIVKTVDSIYGVLSVSLLRGMEDPRRRQYYGRAGEYRLPPYGLEYRVPSSAILAHPIIFHLSYDLARFAMYVGLRVPYVLDLWSIQDDFITHIINEYDIKLSHKIIESNKTILKHIIERLYPNSGAPLSNKVYDLIYNGAIEYLDLSDMEKNWRLGSQWASHSESPNCSVHTWNI